MKNPFKKKKQKGDDVLPYRREYEYKDYPDGGPYVGESLADFHTRKWIALDPDIRKRAAEHLREKLDPDTLEEWKHRIETLGEDWIGADHHFAGTAFRNLLRGEVKDNELPSGNWDDYYVAALEAACGVRAC